VSWYQKGATNLGCTEATDSEWQRHQLGHMQVCTSLQSDNHASTPPLSFLQAGCHSCSPTNNVKALKANYELLHVNFIRKICELYSNEDLAETGRFVKFLWGAECRSSRWQLLCCMLLVSSKDHMQRRVTSIVSDVYIRS